MTTTRNTPGRALAERTGPTGKREWPRAMEVGSFRREEDACIRLDSWVGKGHLSLLSTHRIIDSLFYANNHRQERSLALARCVHGQRGTGAALGGGEALQIARPQPGPLPQEPAAEEAYVKGLQQEVEGLGLFKSLVEQAADPIAITTADDRVCIYIYRSGCLSTQAGGRCSLTALSD